MVHGLRRLSLFGAAALVAAALSPTPAQAQQRAQQRAPADLWCRDLTTEMGPITTCSGSTFEQCMAWRTSHTEICYLNPRYDPRFRR